MSDARDDLPPTRKAVEAWIDRIRPALVADGGNIELLSVENDGTVHIALQGACASCPAQLATLRVGIEAPLKKALRGVRSVVAS
ncbi:MAG: NifU family protein [Deltaproteobacteria bacterium]|nr:NifU family protein [Deltaproteobacteria bacterium]